MISENNADINTSLACAHQFKASVCRTAEEFKDLRVRFFQSLQVAHAMQVSHVSILELKHDQLFSREEMGFCMQGQRRVLTLICMKRKLETIAFKKCLTMR